MCTLFKEEHMSVPIEWKKGGLAYKSGLTLKMAKKMLDAAEKESERLEVPMSIAISDSGGHLVAFIRTDNAILCSIQISMDKAYTAVFGKQPTNFWNKPKPGEVKPSFFHERWMMLPGGLPLIKNNLLLGGIGVSGGSGMEDTSVALKALKAGGFNTRAAETYLSDVCKNKTKRF